MIYPKVGIMWIAVLLHYIFAVYNQASGETMAARIARYERETKALRLENMELEVALARLTSLEYTKRIAIGLSYQDVTTKQIMFLKGGE